MIRFQHTVPLPFSQLFIGMHRVQEALLPSPLNMT